MASTVGRTSRGGQWRPSRRSWPWTTTRSCPGAVTRDLRARYGNDYRVVSTTSGAQALEVLDELALRDRPVALVACDQRMPEMTGIEVLGEVRRRSPDAKLLLLTAYADTDVAIKAINDIGLDYYLLKPWDPPEERLYPVIDDLLGDWQGQHPDRHRRGPRRRPPVVGPQRTRPRPSWPTTTCPTAGSTSSATTRRAS